MTALSLTWEPTGRGGGVVIIRATFDGTAIHTDRVNLSVASARERFTKALCKVRPELDPAAIHAHLLRIDGELAEARDKPAAEPVELDLSRIVRAELFHTPEVSGVAIPAVGFVGGEPAGRWELLLRWHADGKRERRPLSSSIELPDGGRLWLHPLPGEPSTTARPGWSAAARRDWLDGASAPDPAAMFRLMSETIARYIDFAPGTAAGDLATLALWSMFSYVYPAWRAVPYLSVGGPLGSGKSTLFGTVAQLAYRPLQSSNMTAACLFRTLHDMGGTLLLDEAERLREGTPDAGELRSILLSGYKYGSPAMRLEKAGDVFKRIGFDVFGPKALACIGQLPEALASRCIRVTMFRAGQDSPKPRRRIDADPVWAEIRDGLHALALEHGRWWIELSGRSDVCPKELSGRDYELWQPLLSLAAWLDDNGASKLTELLKKHALEVSEAGRDDAVPETDELILRLLARHVVFDMQGTLKAGDLLREASALDPVTFAKWTAKGIGAATARYGLRTCKGTGKTGRTYSRVDLKALRRVEAAYGFNLELPEVVNVPQRTASTADADSEAGNAVGGGAS